MNLKKGDKVVIVTGANKGKQGTISKVLLKSDRVVVEGEGIIKGKKHIKPSQTSPDGGIVDIERAIHASNVMVLDPKTKKPSRIGYKTVTKKVKKQDVTEVVRFAKKSGEVLE